MQRHGADATVRVQSGAECRECTEEWTVGRHRAHATLLEPRTRQALCRALESGLQDECAWRHSQRAGWPTITACMGEQADNMVGQMRYTWAGGGRGDESSPHGGPDMVPRTILPEPEEDMDIFIGAPGGEERRDPRLEDALPVPAAATHMSDVDTEGRKFRERKMGRGASERGGEGIE